MMSAHWKSLPSRLSVTAVCRALRASTEDRVLLLVDTVLQENGLADSSVSLFRACTLCCVHLPKTSAGLARASPPPALGMLQNLRMLLSAQFVEQQGSCWQQEALYPSGRGRSKLELQGTVPVCLLSWVATLTVRGQAEATQKLLGSTAANPEASPTGTCLDSEDAKL